MAFRCKTGTGAQGNADQPVEFTQGLVPVAPELRLDDVRARGSNSAYMNILRFLARRFSQSCQPKTEPQNSSTLFSIFGPEMG